MTSTEEEREEYIAQAWNEAYQRAQPPETAYDEAEKAKREAALRWDRLRAAQGKS